ncbi:predicted protein [Coccidioides posadasii str. Silveira]|uniref:Predicted protein n=1 Tax=Coccidioides posadasii (strain RMSCC 757 / Silveira) TaxID=443226 RepID=E9DE87_COCPS|nr:predicted protein [Coccidioides posadasii str. Silveira]
MLFVQPPPCNRIDDASGSAHRPARHTLDQIDENSTARQQLLGKNASLPDDTKRPIHNKATLPIICMELMSAQVCHEILKQGSTQASPLALKPSSGSEWSTTQANHFWATLKLLVALNLAHAPCIDDGRVNTVILSHHSER